MPTLSSSTKPNSGDYSTGFETGPADVIRGKRRRFGIDLTLTTDLGVSHALSSQNAFIGLPRFRKLYAQYSCPRSCGTS